MQHEINEVLEMIADGRMPPSNMLDDISGGVASLTILRAAAAENPSMMRKLEKLMAVAGAPEIKGLPTKLVNGIRVAMAQKNTTMGARVKEQWSKEVKEIIDDIAPHGVPESQTFRNSNTEYGTLLAPVFEAALGEKLGSTIDKILLLTVAQIVVQDVVFVSAYLAGATALATPLAVIAGVTTAGFVAYKTIPELEAAMRMAASGVRIIAAETYKLVKEEANEVLEAAKALGDPEAINAAKKYVEKTKAAAAEAAKATVKAADNFGQDMLYQWGKVRNEVASVLATSEDDRLQVAYDKAVLVGSRAGQVKDRIVDNTEHLPGFIGTVVRTTLTEGVTATAVGMLKEIEADSKKVGLLERTVNKAGAVKAAAKHEIEKYILESPQLDHKIQQAKKAVAVASKKVDKALEAASSYWDSAMSFVSKATSSNDEAASKKGMVWVEGYVKDTGGKVKGFWRNRSAVVFGNEVGTGTDAIAEGLGKLK